MPTVTLTGRWFDDLSCGDTFTTLGRTVLESDVSQFVGLTGMYEEVFQNKLYVTTMTPYERPIAPGSLVFCIAEGLVVQSGELHGTGVAYLGMSMEILKPVFIGDTVKVTVAVTETRLTSRGDRGVVTTHNRVINQDEMTVMEYWPKRLILRDPTGPAQPAVATDRKGEDDTSA